jgi:hypothetical protein
MQPKRSFWDLLEFMSHHEVALRAHLDTPRSQLAARSSSACMFVVMGVATLYTELIAAKPVTVCSALPMICSEPTPLHS